jgi:hypothetical protein
MAPQVIAQHPMMLCPTGQPANNTRRLCAFSFTSCGQKCLCVGDSWVLAKVVSDSIR